MGKYYSIGDVSKIFDVSIDTLRYYDKIGLIKPKVNPKNKYRYYEVEHLYLLAVVLEARYSEMSIDNIMKFTRSEDLDVYYNFFDNQERELENKINNLKRIKESVKRNKKSLEEIKIFKNNYDIENLKEESSEKVFYKFKIKELITKKNCRRLSDILDDGEETSEYYLSYNILNNSKIEVESGFMYIEDCSKNSGFLKDLKDNLDIWKEKIELKGNLILVKFLGNEREIYDYVNLIKVEKKSSFNNIFVKTIIYISRSKGTTYFAELLLKIN